METKKENLLSLTHNNKFRAVKLISLAIITGICSFGFVGFYTQLIERITEEGIFTEIPYDLVFIFLGLLTVFIVSRRILAKEIIDFSVELFWKLRKDILGLMLKANYQQLKKHKDSIFAGLSSDVHDLSAASMSIIEFAKSAIMIVASLAYMTYLSWQLSIVVFIVAAGGVLIYVFGMKRIRVRLNRARTLENDFMKYFTAIIAGFKEIQMDPRKGRDLYNKKVLTTAAESEENNIKAYSRFLNFQITGQILFYLLIASVLMVFSVTFQLKSTVVVNYMFVLLFLLQAIETLMVMMPSLSKARISTQRVNQLRENLVKEDFRNEESETYFSLDEFESIVVENFNYAYGENGPEPGVFGIGPISFELNKGELIFIYGGNGSGKTTFVQSMLGLLSPDEGLIKYNGEILNAENYKKYRTLFSVVFSDFYLFEEFYGLKEIDEELLNEYLELFEIKAKVEIVDGKFSTIDLSTGQRKRLALVGALIEKKPILVMDEWAADQDPFFRAKFYNEILPLFAEKGITVLAITHDDKYYSVADRLYKMEEGKLIHVKQDEFEHSV
jgi:putative ATP-binding cassette transporter